MFLWLRWFHLLWADKSTFFLLIMLDISVIKSFLLFSWHYFLSPLCLCSDRTRKVHCYFCLNWFSGSGHLVSAVAQQSFQLCNYSFRVPRIRHSIWLPYYAKPERRDGQKVKEVGRNWKQTNFLYGCLWKPELCAVLQSYYWWVVLYLPWQLLIEVTFWKVKGIYNTLLLHGRVREESDSCWSPVDFCTAGHHGKRTGASTGNKEWWCVFHAETTGKVQRQQKQ